MQNGLTPIVRNLLLINLIVYLIEILMQIRFSDLFALYYFESPYFAPWQLITYLFVHANFNHLFGNMLTLFFLGPLLESIFGSRRFLAFYMVCGMGAGIFNYSVIYLEMQLQKQAIIVYEKNPSENGFMSYMRTFEPEEYKKNADILNEYIESSDIKGTVEIVKMRFQNKVENQRVIGASGAVFGIILGAFLLFPNLQIYLFFIPFPIKLGYVAGLLMIFDFYNLLKLGGNSQVAHLAHLGGALIAFILIKYWKIPRQF